MSTIVVGISGGVDSSVAGYLLKRDGHKVIGMFMKNWEETDGSGRCNAQVDFEDARRVADMLGIPYYSVNYAAEYWDKVFSLFLQEYASGSTPNPDVLCNKEIKFGPFLDHAMSIGADKIATGHYAKVVQRGEVYYLYKAKDTNKDQSYFLHQLSQYQLSKTLFPLAEMTKPEVRSIAHDLGLVTAEKKDSTGICFIGERNFREFMKTYLPAKIGVIKDLSGNVVGEHEGVMYYTIGQRRGLNIGGLKGRNSDRWYVVDKDVTTNTLIVNEGECEQMFSRKILVRDFHFISGAPEDNVFGAYVKCRYREADKSCTVSVVGEDVIITFVQPERAVTIGQYAVVYDAEGMCYGGGKIIQILE